MDSHVLIVGAGPTGLMLACELALAGVGSTVIDSLPEVSQEPKANGLLGQVVRVLDHRGLLSELTGIDQRPEPNSAYFMFGALGLDLGVLDRSPIFTLPVPQRDLVVTLERRARELGVDIRRGHRLVELIGLDAARADATAAVIARIRAEDEDLELQVQWVVGADGAHSAVRELAGIEMPGVYHDRMTVRTAHALVPQEWVDANTGALNIPGYGTVMPFLPQRTESGGFSYAPLPGLPPLVTTTEWDQPSSSQPMSLAELEASVSRVLGVAIPLGAPEGAGPHVLRRMHGGNTRIATRFVDGRVVLIGDAAHIFGATGGGPGLNLGLQDAVNLGWKLASVVRGDAPVGILETYEEERRRVAERMVVGTQAQAALIAPGADTTGLRTLFGELLQEPSVVSRAAHLAAGADTRYDMADDRAHDLAGWFCPEFLLSLRHGEAAEGQVDQLRPAQLTRHGKAIMFDFTESGRFAKHLAAGTAGIDVIEAHLIPDSWLPARGVGMPPSALLLRPDGYVAWASSELEPTDTELDGLSRAIERWFGAPR